MRDIKQLNVFEKADFVKKLIGNNIGEIETKKLISMLRRIRNYKYKRDKKDSTLTKEESILYDLLLKYKFNPRTVLDWIRITVIEDDLKLQLKNKETTIKTALREYVKRKRETYSSMKVELMNDIRKIIGGL